MSRADTRPARRGRRTPEEGPRATFRQLVPFLLEHRTVLIVVAILSIIGAVATLAQPLLVGQVIAQVEAGGGLGLLVWGIIALVVAASVISGFQHYLLQRTGTAVVYSSRRQLVARILHLPIREFDARRTGDLVSRVGTDTTLLYAVLTQGLADAVGNSLIFIGALVAMALIDPLLLLAIVVVIGVSITGVVVLSGRIRRATGEQQEKVGELASSVERAVSSIRTVRAAGATEREVTEITGVATDAYGVGVRIAKVSALVVPVAGIALQVSLLVVLGVGGYRVASGAIEVASLVTFILFLFLLVGPLGSFFGAITSVNQALGALGRIQEILNLPTEDADDARLAASVSAASPARSPQHAAGAGADEQIAAIEFRDVWFRYPEAVVAARRKAETEARAVLESAHVDTSAIALPSGTEDATDDASAAPAEASTDAGDVLRGVSFRVPRGSRVAIVGPSGAGKSTTLALIERFYDPTGGAILLGGADIRTLPREELRAQLGYVEQDAPTLAGTIAQNLRLASPEATDADCERVLEAVNLTEVLERSPLRLQAPVGENGVMLSGGERQRLAIARALLAAPPILLLDESTSSLDGLNEQRMRDAIDAVAADRTLLVIAHRLSTVVDSDLIVVMQNGEVIGQGTHGELVESTPLYRDLARHQLLV
ncbi:MAG: ABC transporter ATP-binding protein [Actinobacteria bacterium]|jgi:ATP-binding cassette, subfamily B, bacterial|uniref:ABC transporter ATP-binding protein n=1 Tax=unclassified Microbacterium TaxID=2609290 RepID=UPI00100356BF|nr:ABC transporter ATP-binding protein [Microbacterium sp. UBA837]RUA27811.1 MAG: ABC transporter ATP-binding protein [Actinomycetota bacterium]HIE61388.1 ATP-binding cassette domain-containing protein [Microbacterium sp.]|tara:strand:- start:2667 stop:4643 length:1977 start_codon:yes stop_codon:yes gene_type:complete